MIRAIAIVACALWPLDAVAALVLSPDGITVHDTVNNINWLADANLAATNQFGLPLCNASGAQPCVNPSGSMSYQAAAAWVAAMNAANYLGHTNWQLPTTPITDSGCGKVGPQNNSFGFGCTLNALGSVYYTSLGLKAPNTAVPIPGSTAGPFSRFQPYLYWSQSIGGVPSDACYATMGCGNAALSFNTGFQGANTVDNFLYVLPMMAGKISGAPAAAGTGLQVNPGGQTVYDPVTNVTWLANANLAASNTFGLPPCASPTTPASCVDQDGAMTLAAALQFIANMNAAKYLGQTNWELPPIGQSCSAYNCGAASDPLAELFTGQLGLTQGTPVVPSPDIAIGPFNDIQPYLYWSCQAAALQDACQADGPASGFEWCFSFGNGFLGTDILQNEFYLTAYFVGPASTASGPEITEAANAEGDSPTIAPNTWVKILGVDLGPSGDVRTWQSSDFTGNQMPTELDHVSATVNGKTAFVEYISPTQVNILTPPGAMSGPVPVQLTNNGVVAMSFTAQAQSISPAFFVFPDSYVAAVHLNSTLIGPTTLYPGYSTPAKPGETILLYANGFGLATAQIVTGSVVQSSSIPPDQIEVMIGGVAAQVSFAGLVVSGEFQLNVVVPVSLANGDQSITATYNGVSTQPGALITIQK
jgi:uncharacterized protein (TIGR03437 family)